MYLVYFKVRGPDKVLLIVGPGNVSEDVIKRGWYYSTILWLAPITCKMTV